MLFDLFSEFKSMMNLGRHETPDDPNHEPINNVLPVGATQKMTSFNLKKIMDRINNKDEAEKLEALKSLHPNGLDIPINTFKHYCKALKSQKAALVDKFLHSLGVETEAPHCRVPWEVFL
jgi:hypothetical protein